MGQGFGDLVASADTTAVVLGVGFLIVRQFIWRSADPRRMLRVPLVLIAIGVASVMNETGLLRWTVGDWVVVAELVLVALTGTAMGRVTRFRIRESQLEYRLTRPGLALWAVFIGIRLAVYVLASALGADLASASGLILLSFGINRLAAVAVVRWRARSALTHTLRTPAHAAACAGVRKSCAGHAALGAEPSTSAHTRRMDEDSRATRVVPDFRGLDFEAARALEARSGVKPAGDPDGPPLSALWWEHPHLVVATQDPAPGTEVRQWDSVRVTLSTPEAPLGAGVRRIPPSSLAAHAAPDQEPPGRR